MKFLLFTAVLCIFFARSYQRAPFNDDSSEYIDGEYIVIFNDDVTDEDVAHHNQKLNDVVMRDSLDFESDNDPSFKILSEWKIGETFRGYAAAMNDRVLDEVRNMKEVQHVSRNAINRIESDCITEHYTFNDIYPWGICRTCVHEFSIWKRKKYVYKKNVGASVKIYVVDTGIDTTHEFFEGRAHKFADLVSDPPHPGDPNGHGTMVAGIAVAQTFGMARGANVYDVRTFDAQGHSFTQRTLDAMKKLALEKVKNRDQQMIAIFSFGAEYSEPENKAADALADQGIFVVTSAGNKNSDACMRSPAGASKVITVAASTIKDQKYVVNQNSGSGWGKCVHMIAPGENIASLKPGGYLDTSSGTSFAVPHVAGIIAKVLDRTKKYDNQPVNMRSYIQSIALKNKISGFDDGQTPNLLAFFDCENTKP